MSGLPERREALRSQLREAREAKKEVASRFGPARARGEPLGPLKDEMSRVSAAHDAVEAELKALDEAMNEAMNGAMDGARRDPDPEEAHPPLPPHFRPWAEGAAVGETSGDPPALSIRRVEPRDEAALTAFLADQPRAGSWSSRRWSPAFTGPLGAEELSLVAWRRGSEGGAGDAPEGNAEGSARDGEILGYLPVFRLRSRLFGHFLVSVPFVSGGGPVTENPHVRTALLDELGALRAREGADFAEIRTFAAHPGWPTRTDKVSMVLRLPATDEELDTRLGSKIRSQVRRGEREGTRVTFGRGPRFMDGFYDVFAENMRDLGTPVYARSFFDSVMAEWGDDATIALAEIGGRAVGGGLLIRHRSTLEIPWASTLGRFNPAGVNMTLYRQILNHAVATGCQWFDFGRSSEGSGTYRFKAQWGAIPVQHHWLYHLPEGSEMPGLRPDSPRFRTAVGIWKRLPVALTRWIGPPIVRHLP